MLILILILVSLAFPQIKIFSTESNEGAFAIRKLTSNVCFAGRRDEGNNGYDALFGVCSKECRIFVLGSDRDDYSYTVERYGRGCMAGVTTLARGNMDMVLVVFGNDKPETALVLGGNGNDMLWFMRKVKDGYVLVGGVQDKDWDILIIKLGGDLKVLWSKRIGTTAEEYAYGVVEYRNRYYVVGRSNFRGNWDGFFLELTPDAKIVSAKLFGSDSKDYLRYVGIYKNKVLAVGRSEARDTSDVLMVFPESGKYFLYDGGDFDYGRVFTERDNGLLVMGDTYKDGDSDGMALLLDGNFRVIKGFAIGRDGIESIRYLTKEGLFAGYTYSFTLDNDLMIGKFSQECGTFVRPKEFKEVSAKLRFYDYPVKVKNYKLEPLQLSLPIKEINMKTLDPC